MWAATSQNFSALFLAKSLQVNLKGKGSVSQVNFGEDYLIRAKKF